MKQLSVSSTPTHFHKTRRHDHLAMTTNRSNGCRRNSHWREYPSHGLELHRKPCCENGNAIVIDISWTLHLDVNIAVGTNIYMYWSTDRIMMYVQASKWHLYFEITLFNKTNETNNSTLLSLDFQFAREKMKINVCPSPWIFYILANLRF